MFCCNTVPSRYHALGIDYPTLSSVKPDLIWAGISAMGPDYPDVPGYDPVIQAMCGYMEVTGDPQGSPTQMGLPVIDLKAGDEVYANVMLALLERSETGHGKQINVSMLQAAASWLITVLPLIDFDCEPSEITRAGNEHRKFIPTNVYPTKDGFIYLAIGSDVQWRRLTAVPKFACVANDVRVTNEGRHQEREAIHRDMAAVTSRHSVDEVLADLRSAGCPVDAHFRHPPSERAAAAAGQAHPYADAEWQDHSYAADGRRCRRRSDGNAFPAEIWGGHAPGACASRLHSVRNRGDGRGQRSGFELTRPAADLDQRSGKQFAEAEGKYSTGEGMSCIEPCCWRRR